MGFQSTLVWKLLERRVLAVRASNRHSPIQPWRLSSDRLIVTRDRQFFKALGLESPMPFGSGTRQRPPQSSFVQTRLQWMTDCSRDADFSGVIWPTVNRLIAGSSRGRGWYHAAFRANKFAISVEELRRIVASSPNLPDLAQRKDARRRDHAKSS